ncbi:DUF6631 family protein [Luteimonas fraxinea]|uniref:Uncharacterized protein n=1 Tax=Luteimonas fraxinea TaxID=2901869 RepID=A0ABS8UDH2_9GAMM|nr:DUF6631 family protein [Luteimonas fraxinea]MCD9097042.1 hypothetical protein [Luteimonas fraxinea]
MARDVTQQVNAAGTAPAAEADALAVLHPDTALVLGGREITVREYEFFEGLEVAHRASQLIADMHQLCRDGVLRYDRIRRLFGKHRDVVLAIAAQAADVEQDWVAGLPDNEKDVFLNVWFGVNADFFVREVVVEIREERQRSAVQGERSTGATSSSASPMPASATSTGSDATPSAS